jgi:putative transposase
MRRIKVRTSSDLFKGLTRLKKRYWRQRFGASRYFCISVGQMSEEMIKEYFEHHFKPSPNDDFRMEAL